MTQPSTTMPPRTIGIDLGDRESTYCVLDEAGEIIEQDSLRNERAALEQRFGCELPGGS